MLHNQVIDKQEGLVGFPSTVDWIPDRSQINMKGTLGALGESVFSNVHIVFSLTAQELND